MTAINEVTDLSRQDDIAVITLNYPPVNALSAVLRNGLYEALQRAIDDPAVKAIVLMCAGRTFVAGADISEFGGVRTGASLLEIEKRVEDSPKAVVAAIHGTALGGGLELALCAHYRVAVPSAVCGLPEVNIGLLPGGGGTQRLARLVGVHKALEMVTSGQHLPAPECLEAGLIDALAEEGHLREEALALARRVIDEQRPLKKVRELQEKLAPGREHPQLFAEFRRANARKFRGFKAPEYNIRCIEAAVNLPFDEGLKVERALFMELVSGPQSAAQRYYFFAERAANKIPDVPSYTPTRPVRSVGIIGAGTMGGGIAMNFANAGIPVALLEVTQEALDRGIKTVRSNYERSAKSGRFTAADVEQRMQLIEGSLDFDRLREADLIIEAVFERMDIKQDIFRRLDALAKPAAILATNTSALNVDEIASATRRPESVIGLHFFSPANVMKLLEIVRGAKTGKDVIATSMKLAKTIRKVAVLVGVCPGFVGNRMLRQRGIQTQQLLLDGVLPWDIDRVLYEFGFPMGPFAMSDLAGLDIGWSREHSKSETIRDILCEMGRRGQKTRAGYYDYDDNRNSHPSPVTEQVIREFVSKSGGTPRAVSDQEILERSIYAMINEGAKILAEKMAIRASDIDVVWVNGYGWPVYRGGPMYFADQIGLEKVLARLNEFRQSLGEAFKPAPLLEQLVKDGRKFADLK
jgi:3-hydroxyacyl-CoA dehydrogenase